VLVAKYCDHLPLYRQSQIFARQGVELDRSTLANWVGGAVWWLEPLLARLSEHVFSSRTLFADDTPIPVLEPGRGRTKTGRLWVYARDDRPWNGPDPPAVVYLYSPDRRAERPTSHLSRFKGIVQVDGYPGFERLCTTGDIQLAACWAHARRKFYEVHQATGSPVAGEAIRRIAELYAVETTIRGHTARIRQDVRRIKSLPLVDAMKIWLGAELNRVPPRGGLADAIRYALARWNALCHFLHDGRLEIDNNTVERAIRPIAMLESLCIPSSSVCKHWNRFVVSDATRATFSGHRRLDRFRRQVVGANLVWRAGHNLHRGQHAGFEQAAYRVACDA